MALVIVGGSIFLFTTKQGQQELPPIAQEQKEDKSKSSNPEFLFTKPEGLEKDNHYVLPTQTIEITFNQPIENIGEFKHRLEPTIKYQAKLSDDKKTVIIKPEDSYPVGTDLTLFIQADTKFDGKKTLGKDVHLHFKTLQYKGV